MKRSLISCLGILTFLIVAVAATASAPATRTDDFDRLKSLSGEWEGMNKNGEPVHVVYSLTSAGSVVMEQIEPGSDHAMVTMYHKDGDRLMMTHYCAAGNQPRMRTAKSQGDGRSLTFSYLDATNLAKSSDPHMVKLVFDFTDQDHLVATWTYQGEGGKDTIEVFRMTRKS